MIEYRLTTPKKYKCLYCGYSPLEIWAFTWTDYKTSKEKATPVLVCTDRRESAGCGTFFDPSEYDLTPRHKDLLDGGV